MKNTKNDLVAVTLLKGAAIIMILVCHIVLIFPVHQIVWYIGVLGQMGCQLFFIISCFTICLSYETTRPTYTQFIKHRAWRIVPHYWLAIAFFVLLAFLIQQFLGKRIIHIQTDALRVIPNLLLLNGLVPRANNNVVRGGWFIGAIAVLYLLFPYLFKLWKSIPHIFKRLSEKIGVLLAVQILSTVILHSFGLDCQPDTFGYYFFLNQLPCFMSGFILYDLYQETTLTKSERKKAGIRSNPFDAFAPLKCLGSLLIGVILFYSRWKYSFNMIPFFFGLGYVYLTLWVIHARPIQKGGVMEKAVLAFGKESFGIYLIHLLFVNDLAPLLLDKIENLTGVLRVSALLILALMVFPASYYAGKLFNTVVDKMKNWVTKNG